MLFRHNVIKYLLLQMMWTSDKKASSPPLKPKYCCVFIQQHRATNELYRKSIIFFVSKSLGELRAASL